MRGHCVCLVAILAIVPSAVWAASDGIPTLDVRPVCRGIASQSADPGVGQIYNAARFWTAIAKVVGTTWNANIELLRHVSATRE
jgi:hypothetical protein